MPPRRTRRKLGNFGEAAAAAHLTQHGYAILERQWRCQAGEVDLIVRQGDMLVFVEVRTRHTGSYGSPEESVTTAKQMRLIALAHTYLETHNLHEQMPWRIDVIAVVVDNGGRVCRLNHIINAVEG